MSQEKVKNEKQSFLKMEVRSFSGKEMTFLRKKDDRDNFGISKVCWMHLATL